MVKVEISASQAASRNTPPNGVLVVDKPEGPTSHDIVAQARRYFGTRQVGHAGTLDPMASGVLLILLGEGTKLSNALTLERKSYEATVTFGTATDTDDARGKVISELELAPDWLSTERLDAALEAEHARITQIPPVVTAIKQDGMTAYHRYRKGLPVEVKPRDVAVFELTRLERGANSVRLALTVSKGYYVRALARDLGERLGVPAHLSALRRTASGAFHIEEAQAWPPQGVPQLLDLTSVVRRVLPCVVLTDEGTERARVGKPLSAEHVQLESTANAADCGLCTNLGGVVPNGLSAWLDSKEQLVALGVFEPDGQGRVQRGFVVPLN